MAKNRALRRQARAIASAGLPSAGSIRRQYHRQEGDVAGFSSALVSLLKGQQGTAGQAYGQAISQQQSIDDAARQQLGNLGEQYGPGSAVKVGATGDSAISSLLGGQAAAQDYASRQPGIAASRGALGQTALQNALADALSQRADQVHSGFLPAYMQLKQNAFSQKMALSQLGLSQQAQAFNESQAALSQANTDRSFREQQREFNVTRRDALRTATAAGFTPNEVQNFRSDIFDAISTAKKGIPLVGGKGHQLVHGDTRKPRWKVPPAPLGAVREPGQSNSIFALYQFLSSRYDPQLQPLILAELRAAYPASTWRVFAQQMSGSTGPSGSRATGGRRHR